MTEYPQIVSTNSGLDIEAMSAPPGLVALVNTGPHSALTVTGGCRKIQLMDKMTPTRVAIQKEVPRVDLGVIPLTLTFGGNTAIYQDVLQEVEPVSICTDLSKTML